MKLTYRHTIISCFVGYITQAIINNFVPLLFITFQNSYQIPLHQITALVTVNFAVQLTVDLLASRLADRIGYRVCIVTAHLFAVLGLVLLTVLPELLPPFWGILTAVSVYAIGGGLIEVLISPITESCPTDNKESAMSLLHSFYCWGHVGVVLLTTLFFHFAGIQNWRLMALLWALIPLCNAFVFMKVPIGTLIPEGQSGMTLPQLFRTPVFWLLMLMMVCSGASEQAVSQWASAFAETGLGISKTAGDLAGPMSFAICMGAARAVYGKWGQRMDLDRFMKGSILLCVASYLLISLSPWPALSLVGCALCGMSVGILWPGTFSKASVALKTGGTAMFALLALAGDLGCAGGPTVVGSFSGNGLQGGILAAILFPLTMLLCLFFWRQKKSTNP